MWERSLSENLVIYTDSHNHWLLINLTSHNKTIIVLIGASLTLTVTVWQHMFIESSHSSWDFAVTEQ